MQRSSLIIMSDKVCDVVMLRFVDHWLAFKFEFERDNKICLATPSGEHYCDDSNDDQNCSNSKLQLAGDLSWITPALTEASISVEVVKPEEDTMVAERTSDDWPTLQLGTLRFNALLSRQRDDLLHSTLFAWRLLAAPSIIPCRRRLPSTVQLQSTVRFVPDESNSRRHRRK